MKVAHVVAYPKKVRNSKQITTKGCALIRANLHADALQADTYGEWAELYAQALWLERWRLRNQAEMIAALFGEKKR